MLCRDLLLETFMAYFETLEKEVGKMEQIDFLNIGTEVEFFNS